MAMVKGKDKVDMKKEIIKIDSSSEDDIKLKTKKKKNKKNNDIYNTYNNEFSILNYNQINKDKDSQDDCQNTQDILDNQFSIFNQESSKTKNNPKSNTYINKYLNKVNQENKSSSNKNMNFQLFNDNKYENNENNDEDYNYNFNKKNKLLMNKGNKQNQENKRDKQNKLDEDNYKKHYDEEK